MNNIFKAGPPDIPSLLPLINSAYRGEASRQGWTTEADIIEGDQRIGEAELAEALQEDGAVMLKYVNDDRLEGCVYLKPTPEGLYLGMLSVWPWLQNKGVGRQLMLAAEEVAKEKGIDSIVMHVISIRSELIAWYERLGYQRTGETLPFDDFRFGIPRVPMVFDVLKKEIVVAK